VPHAPQLEQSLVSSQAYFASPTLLILHLLDLSFLRVFNFFSKTAALEPVPYASMTCFAAQMSRNSRVHIGIGGQQRVQASVKAKVFPDRKAERLQLWCSIL
jgi:hypothetical protein